MHKSAWHISGQGTAQAHSCIVKQRKFVVWSAWLQLLSLRHGHVWCAIAGVFNAHVQEQTGVHKRQGRPLLPMCVQGALALVRHDVTTLVHIV